MPGRFELTSTLAKIWHAPDHFRLLDPLPPMHRRGIIAGFLLVIIGILLPSDDSQSPASTSREANLNLQSQSQPQAGGNQAVPLPPITNTPTVSDADQMAPVAPEPIQDEQPDQAQTQQPAATQPYQSSSQQSAPGIEQQWRTYRIESGKTLAQLFRDHGLPATDVYAMAQVEGAGKPLALCRADRRCRFGRTPTAWSPGSLSIPATASRCCLPASRTAALCVRDSREDDSKRYAAAK